MTEAKEPKLFFSSREPEPKSQEPKVKLVPAEKAPPLEEWLELNRVLPLMPRKWCRRQKRNALLELGVCRKAGPRRVVVVVKKLREKCPEIYQAILSQHVEETSSVE